MATRLTDIECHDLAQQMAVGRTQNEMLPIVHAGHEAVTLAAERLKHKDLIARRGAATAKGAALQANGQIKFDKGCWDDLFTHLSDGQGSPQIVTALGLVWKALFQQADQCEVEFQLYALLKAVDATFPDVRKTIESELADSAGKKKP